MSRLKVFVLSIFAVGISLTTEARGFSFDHMSPIHEVRFTVGAYPVLFDGGDVDGCIPMYPEFSNENYENLLIFKDRYVSGSFSLGYNYRVLKWLSVGLHYHILGRLKPIIVL